MPDLLGLIAPRGLFLESDDTDRVFPRQPAVKAYEQLKRIYADRGAPAYAWLREKLTTISL
ncbi:hypothetical protein FE782_12840 [Paenibacillus antri]|uniref:Uncharacterized protein n=1 Tax=Paenibacillus antri TaxID=2582848 RepID=A0A5R9GEZ5_9BACL|nr:hypothetical protein [Paenibacillus antri]TLS51794.1 hypothetical protein FE782_12840 [Paenibacillus antri]